MTIFKLIWEVMEKRFMFGCLVLIRELYMDRCLWLYCQNQMNYIHIIIALDSSENYHGIFLPISSACSVRFLPEVILCEKNHCQKLSHFHKAHVAVAIVFDFKNLRELIFIWQMCTSKIRQTWVLTVVVLVFFEFI